MTFSVESESESVEMTVFPQIEGRVGLVLFDAYWDHYHLNIKFSNPTKDETTRCSTAFNQSTTTNTNANQER